MTFSANPAHDANNHYNQQAKHSQLIKQIVADITDSQNDVVEAFSQCSAAALSYEQEQRLHKAYEDNDCLELGTLLSELMSKQIEEMAEAIS